MSLSEEKNILLSQLVDGELPLDQANQVLADMLDELTHVLGNTEATAQLGAMLQLRQTLDPWRRQAPPKTVVALPSAPANGKTSHFRWHVLSLASAALLGGILVAGGYVLGGRFGTERATLPTARQPVIIVTPEQRREIARAFALHESVAGPLSWYAADDANIRVAPAGKEESLRQPIAVVLRLTRDLSDPNHDVGPETYVIVCRNNDAATIELPQSAVAKSVHLRLLPTAANGEVSLQYAISTDGSGHGPDEAALAGRRHVALGQTSLGQLAVNNGLLNVDASAWVVKN